MQMHVIDQETDMIIGQFAQADTSLREGQAWCFTDPALNISYQSRISRIRVEADTVMIKVTVSDAQAPADTEKFEIQRLLANSIAATLAAAKAADLNPNTVFDLARNLYNDGNPGRPVLSAQDLVTGLTRRIEDLEMGFAVALDQLSPASDLYVAMAACQAGDMDAKAHDILKAHRPGTPAKPQLDS